MGDPAKPEPGTPEPVMPTQATKLPDDHPLVTAYSTVKAELAQAKDKIRAAEDAEKSELQKLQDSIAERDQQLSELPATVRKQAIRFASTASHLGFVDPEDALVLVGDVDLADDAAVKAALEDLAERKPHLVRADAGPRVPARPKPKDGQQAPGGPPADGRKAAAEALRALTQK